MLLKLPKHFHKKLSVRLTVWYSGIFILSSLVCGGLALIC
jgi:hypothetical protein